MVADDAVTCHLQHGDSLGACGCPEPSCEFTPLRISAQAKGKMDGSVDHPFASIEKALKLAEKRSLACVELFLDAGIYTEDTVNVTRNIRLTGITQGVVLATQIRNHRAHSLYVQDVSFVGNGGPAKAAVEVANECATTTLVNVLFDNIVGNSLHQTGGTLRSENVTVNLTHRNEHIDSGIGLWLGGGVKACMTDFTATDNAAAGLVARDSDTRILLSGALAERNGVGLKAVDGALMLGQDLTLNDNLTNGIRLDGGAEAHLRELRINRTTSTNANDCVIDPFNTVIEPCAANVRIGPFGGVLNITTFALCQSEHVGFSAYSEPALDGPDVDVVLRNGENSNNLIRRSESGRNANVCRVNTVAFNNQIDSVPEKLDVPKPIVEFRCSDGIDNDFDGAIDLCDTDCSDPPQGECEVAEVCDDLIDNNSNGLIDCGDPFCSSWCSRPVNCMDIGFAPTWCDTDLENPLFTHHPRCPQP
jgi:hypothetical protein